jgi:hypothetical protein
VRNSHRLQTLHTDTHTTRVYLLALLCLIAILGCIPFELSEISFSLFLFGVIALGAADFRLFLILAFPIYALGGSLFSVVLIERGMYVTEQFRYGSQVGATSALAGYAFGFLLMAHIGMHFFLRRKRKVVNPGNPKAYRRLIYVLNLLIAFFYLFVFVFYGLGTDERTRFDWLASLPTFVEKLSSFFMVFIMPITFALSGFYLKYFGKSKSVLLLLLVPLVAAAGTGEKFSAFAGSFLTLFMGLGLAAYLKNERLRFNWRANLIGLLASFSIAVSLISGFRRLGANNFLDAAIERVVLQGHVWFGIFEQYRGAPTLVALNIFGINTLEQPAGLDYLSYLVSDESFVFARISRGISFTMGGPAGVLGVFGFLPGFVVFTLMGLLYVAAVSTIVWALNKKSAILTAAAFCLFIIVGNATLMGRWDDSYSMFPLFLYSYLFFAWVHFSFMETRKSQQHIPLEKLIYSAK